MHRFKHLNATKGLLLSRALDLISVGRGLRDEWIVGSDRALELFCVFFYMFTRYPSYTIEFNAISQMERDSWFTALVL